MPPVRKGKETTILAFRHLGSVGTQARSVLHEGPDGHPIAPYQKIIDAVADARREGPDFDREAFKQKVQEPLASEEIRSFLATYKTLGPDAKFSILPGEEERGRRIGESVQESGETVTLIETSSLTRAVQSAVAVRSGLGDPEQPVRFNDLAKERRWGRNIEEVANESFFFALHPEQLAKAIREGENYRGGGKGAESDVQFRRRMGSFVEGLQYARRYSGRTTAIFGHSDQWHEAIRQLGGEIPHMPTGSYVRLTAQPRSIGEWIIGRPRRFTISNPISPVPR